LAYGDVPNGTRNGDAPGVFELGRELVLEDFAALISGRNHGIFLKFPFIGEHLL